jgi:hypothetical protein
MPSKHFINEVPLSVVAQRFQIRAIAAAANRFASLKSAVRE